MRGFALWLRFRALLRARWRTWLLLSAIVGLGAGAATGLMAGARRTETAYERFRLQNRGHDAVVVNYPGDGKATFDFGEISRLPSVESASWGPFDFMHLGTDVAWFAPVAGDVSISTPKILKGRAADPSRADEVVIPFSLAEQFDITIGTLVPFLDPGLDIEQCPPAEAARLTLLLDAVPGGLLRVVGIAATPGGFPPQRLEDLVVLMTPTFGRLFQDSPNGIMLARLRGGRSGVTQLLDELEHNAGGLPVQLQDAGAQADRVNAALHVQATGLRLIGILLALSLAVVAGQVLAREQHIEAAEADTLAARWPAPVDDRRRERRRSVHGLRRNTPTTAGGGPRAEE